jgi:hypothetical protein
VRDPPRANPVSPARGDRYNSLNTERGAGTCNSYSS